MAVFKARIKGTYRSERRRREVIAEGTVQQDENGLRSCLVDGKERNEGRSGSLKDESGTIWTLDNPKTTSQGGASLRQGLRKNSQR